MRSFTRLLMRLLFFFTVSGMVLTFTGQGLAEEPQLLPAECVKYVNVNVSGGDHSGTSWTNADPDLQHAITNAAAGCEIWVAKGTYGPKGSSRLDSVFLKEGVSVYGGFSGNGTETNRTDRDWQTNVTTISGEKGSPHPVDNDNYYNVVWAYQITSAAILDGFTITGGYADDANYHYGGGIEIIQSSPTLSNLKIVENQAYFGGGIDFTQSSPALTNVSFWNNYTLSGGGSGGGAYVRDNSHPNLHHVQFYNNVSNSTANEGGGGGLYNDQTSGGLNLTDVLFQGNSAAHGGGGMYNYKVHANLIRVRFLFNHAAFGGGLLMDGEDYTHSQLVNVEFDGNEAISSGGKGGGLFNYQSSPLLINVFFAKNSAYYYGGGIGNYKSSPTLTNVSFSLNTAPNGAGIYNSENSHPIIHNSILWGDTTGEIYHDPGFAASTVTIAYSLVQGCNPGGTWNTALCGTSGGNNLTDADPNFEDPGNYDLHLTIGSPAINKGSNDYASVTPVDMDEGPRVQNGIVDLGPYELLFYPIYLPFMNH
jgi:predicted outer membrane repeat protein